MWDFFFWSSLPAIDRWRENAVFTVFFLHSNYKMHHTSLFSHCGKQMRRLPQRAALMFCAKRCLAKSRRWSFHYLDSVETVLLYLPWGGGDQREQNRLNKEWPKPLRGPHICTASWVQDHSLHFNFLPNTQSGLINVPGTLTLQHIGETLRGQDVEHVLTSLSETFT